jgi:hypothetical protein
MQHATHQYETSSSLMGLLNPNNDNNNNPNYHKMEDIQI